MDSICRIARSTRTTLPPSLARGGTARLVALLLVSLLAIPTICFCQGSTNRADFLAQSNSQFVNGKVSVGYFQDGDFVEYNTPFTVCKGVIGWCMDNCPGPDGDVTLNITDAPIKHNDFTWLPGVLYVNPGFGSDGVAIEFMPNKTQAVNCVGSFSVKPGTLDKVNVRITKNTTSLRGTTLDSGNKQDSSVLSAIAEIGVNDRLYFNVSNMDNERCNLVGIQLFVAPVDAKLKIKEKMKPAFVVAKR